VKPELQHQLVDRVLAHLERRTTDTEPAPTLLPVASYYVGPAGEARFAREHTALFRELPVLVGHVSQIPNPGDFFTHDASGVPLLITRDDTGAINAFLNVCRHRGTRVEPAACGAKKTFVCPYHSWSYGRDGALLGIPHERGFATIARDERGLARVPCGVAAGLIFVKPTAESARPVELAASASGAIRAAAIRDAERAHAGTLDAGAWLGPQIVDDLVGFGLASFVTYAPRRIERALNWKLAIDVFLETYHLRPVHKDSIFPMFFDNVGLVDPIGPHLRNIFPKRSIKDLAAQPRDTWALRRHANVLYHLFPNTLILVEPDHAGILTLWPQGPRGTLLTSFTLVPEAPVTDKARAYWDANNAILNGAVDEDFVMGESIQAGLASGANTEVVFGAFEHALAHFHRQVEQLAAR
jgi:phenylpropionate dioxygenase-like ring-hydroxylating dioxygenase large terminal subunit